MTQKIPHQVRTRIAFHVAQLVDHANALKGVERARGKGHILSLEMADRKQRIEAAFDTLTEIYELAVKHKSTAEFLELVVNAGIPDIKPFGFAVSDIPSWAHLHAETGFHVTVEVEGTATDPDDENLPGEYPFWVKVTRPIKFASLTIGEKTEIAKAVLDEFHNRQGIEVLEDFEITVFLPNDEAISESDEHETTHLVESVSCDW